MVWPLPPLATVALLLGVLAVVFVWWISRRVHVAHPPIALMITRIGFPPGMRIADPDKALAMLELRDEIVIPYSRAILVIEFPLTHPAEISISAGLPQGFTRGELVRIVCEEYGHIYAAEEGTSFQEPSIEERGSRRERTRTDGAYGIWGHALEDLVLSSLRWVKQSNGDVRIELHVESKPAHTAEPDRQLKSDERD